MVVKWTFTDSDANSYVFEVNPNDQVLGGYKKNIGYASTTAPGGKVLVFEGREEPKTGSFSGISLSQAQHEAFVTWYEKRDQITMTDDLNRTFVIIITAYEANRKWTRSHPYRHDYSVEYIVVDWP